VLSVKIQRRLIVYSSRVFLNRVTSTEKLGFGEAGFEEAGFNCFDILVTVSTSQTSGVVGVRSGPIFGQLNVNNMNTNMNMGHVHMNKYSLRIHFSEPCENVSGIRVVPVSGCCTLPEVLLLLYWSRGATPRYKLGLNF